MEDRAAVQELQPTILPIEQVSVSRNLDVIGIPLEHNVGEWQRYETLLKDEIGKVDGVIFEYFPEEMTDWKQNPLIQQTYDLNLFLPFFEKLAEEVKNQNKEVYVLDPAHDNAFVWVRGLPYGLMGAGAGAVGKSLWDGFGTAKISRRQFISKLGLGALGLAAVGSGVVAGPSSFYQEKRSNTPTTRFSETDFRRTVIAKGISQMGEQPNTEQTDKKRRVLIVYPPVHWEGIKGLLRDRDNLDKKFQGYSLIQNVMSESQKDSLFSIRRYKWTNNAWNKLSTRIK